MLILLGVPPGRGPRKMSEGADKVGVVGEAGKLARLLHADPLLQQLPGHKHPAVDDILHHGEAGGRLEDAAQIVLADEEFSGDLIQLQRFRQMGADIVQNGGDPHEVLVLDGLAGVGGVESGSHPQQHLQQRNCLADVAPGIGTTRPAGSSGCCPKGRRERSFLTVG